MTQYADLLIITETLVETEAIIRVFQEDTGQKPKPIMIKRHLYHDLGEINTTRVFMVRSEIGAAGNEYSVSEGVAALYPSAVVKIGLAFGTRPYGQKIGDILVSQKMVIFKLPQTWSKDIVKISEFAENAPKEISCQEQPHASPWLLNHFQNAQLYWDDQKVGVHFGTVISINALIADRWFRDKLLELSPRAIGGEIGGEGLYSACQDKYVDWIMVQSICDWADGNKNDGSAQRIAARNAARYLVHTLKIVPLKRNEGTLEQPKQFGYIKDHSDNLITAGSNVDVGIVIALDEEFQELFPQIEVEHIYEEETSQYYYYFEREKAFQGLAPYKCIATFVGGMGPTKAALLSDRLLEKFKPTTLVNIGIAGSMDKAVFVGDVVVAEQADEYLDSSKVVSSSSSVGWEFELSGDPYKSDPVYVSHIRNLKFAFKDSTLKWIRQCKSRLEKSLDQTTIEKLLSNGLLRETPQIFTGHVASGPTVVSTDQFIKWLKQRRDRKYLAVEMESAGVLNAAHSRRVSALIIRGISDYSDRRKAKLDKIKEGVLRRYAMNNALDILWTLMNLQLMITNGKE